MESNGRIWIFGCSSPLSGTEQKEISSYMNEFCAQWAAHGNALQSKFDIRYDRMLILKVNEDFEPASGCSIDTAMDAFRQVDNKYQLDLFNRMRLHFLERSDLKVVMMADLSEALRAGEITADSLFLDSSISNAQEWEERWERPLKDSWLSKRVKQFV